MQTAGPPPSQTPRGPVAFHALWLAPLEMRSAAAPNQDTGHATSGNASPPAALDLGQALTLNSASAEHRLWARKAGRRGQASA